MSESITVCENLARDFSWLPDFLKWFSSLIAGFGPVLALWGAIYLYYKKQEAERDAVRRNRNALVAEETLMAIHDFDSALRLVRHPPVDLPPVGADRRSHEWVVRLERMQGRKADFDKLRQMEVRAKAFLGNSNVDSAIAELFSIWTKLWAALDSLYRGDENTQDADLTTFYADLRKQARGSYSHEDEFGARQIAALEIIQTELYPLLRLQSR